MGPGIGEKKMPGVVAAGAAPHLPSSTKVLLQLLLLTTARIPPESGNMAPTFCWQHFFRLPVSGSWPFVACPAAGELVWNLTCVVCWPGAKWGVATRELGWTDSGLQGWGTAENLYPSCRCIQSSSKNVHFNFFPSSFLLGMSTSILDLECTKKLLPSKWYFWGTSIPDRTAPKNSNWYKDILLVERSS